MIDLHRHFPTSAFFNLKNVRGAATRVRAAIRWSTAIVVVGAVVLGLPATKAWSQAGVASGFALDRFEPAGGGSDWFTLESLDLRGKLRPAFGLTGNWAWKPLAIYNQDGSENAVLVRHQMLTHLGASLNLWDRVRVGVHLPVAIFQGGDGGTLGGVSYAAARDAGFGDLRTSADVRLFGAHGDSIRLAAGAQIFLPTGRDDQYLGDPGFRVAPRLLAAGDIGKIAYALRLGYRYRAQSPSSATDAGAFQGVSANSEVTAGAGMGVRFTPALFVGLELSTTTVASASDFLDRRSTPVELLGGGHFTFQKDWRIGLGAVPGLTDGVGTPALRVVAQIEYFPAVRRAEPLRQPPPPLLALSPPAPALPDLPPPPPPAPAPAPPADADADGIVDSEDACPDMAGVKTDDAATSGCPPAGDKDKDGIVDGLDACPDHPGPTDVDEKKNGCPVVRIEGGQVRIVEQVKFKTNRAVILKESDYVLDAVVKLLMAHTEITKVRVEGHTDNRGKPKKNKKLSERRAASVMKWLVKHGVPRKKLTSAGFGQEKPRATNVTEAGRSENRRVEFHIADIATAGAVPELGR